MAKGIMTLEHEELTMLDFEDQLCLPPDLVETLKGPASGGLPASVELRQYMAPHLTAGILHAGKVAFLTMKAVQRKALAMRRGFSDHALRAESSLGPTLTHLTQAETDFRLLCHSSVRRDHENKFQVRCCFPSARARSG
ncbi:unnamed protein product, partial [Polarella glacialis]